MQKIKNLNHSRALNVSDLLAPIVGSRDVVNQLAPIIKATNEKAVYLDFSDIEFISRSAAHELLQLKDSFAEVNKSVYFINLPTPVEQMLEVVAVNRAVATPYKQQFSPKEVDAKTFFEKV
jgi:anti-anti-sigma regulatory factor